MCGRYTQTVSLKKLMERFGFKKPAFPLSPRYNIAPTQLAPVVVEREGRALEMMQWGLVPSWAEDPAIGNRMINARAETLAEKPSFKRAFQRRRCLVVADGFYEWQAEAGKKGKTPWRFVLKSGEPFGMAGLWEVWHGGSESELHSFTIVTTEANPLLKKVHDRMPAILSPEDEGAWLDPANSDVAGLQKMLRPFSPGEMQGYPVNTLVNSPRNEAPECIVPAR